LELTTAPVRLEIHLPGVFGLSGEFAALSSGVRLVDTNSPGTCVMSAIIAQAQASTPAG